MPPLRTAFPRLPSVAELPARPELPSVLRSPDGSTLTSAGDWPAQRLELRRVLEHYADGHAPPAPARVRSAEIECRALRGGVVYRLLRLSLGPSERSFSTYHLHVEWRWPEGAPDNSNSGVMVHVAGENAIWPSSFECQLRNGNAGQVVGLGLDIPAAPLERERKRAPRWAPASEAARGQWNSYEIYARGDELLVYVNGVLPKPRSRPAAPRRADCCRSRASRSSFATSG